MAKFNQETKQYVCKFCGKAHTILSYAVSCEESHGYVYIPMTKEMVNRLLNFIYNKDDSLLEDNIGQATINILKRYTR